MMKTVRIGIVGLGANTRLRHVPGFRACEQVEILGVCNRSRESTARAAEEFEIPRTYDRWEQLVADPDLDAVLIGTWPYLHAPITLAALEQGKHVLTEARMARNAAEAEQMLAASQARPELVTQIVPSPLGLGMHRTMLALLEESYLGELREFVVLGTNDGLLSPEKPWHWRQSAEWSGLNMLTLGILHETLIRWIDSPVRVQARTQTFVSQRSDPATGEPRAVGTPDSVQVLSELAGGAIGAYHLSGVLRFGPGIQIQLYGTEGVLRCQFQPKERIFGARSSDRELTEIAIPPEQRGGWRVEQEFIGAIRGEEKVQFTDFSTGLQYMRFTQAVAESAAAGTVQEIPLD